MAHCVDIPFVYFCFAVLHRKYMAHFVDILSLCCFAVILEKARAML